MGKICWINGQPYSVGLPTGGENKNDRNNQWDEMIDFLGEDCNNFFHWKDVSSWCQERVNESSRAVRGYYSACHWFSYLSFVTNSYPAVGFRPILTPLNMDTLKPDLSLLADIPDGQRIALASLRLGGNPIDLSEENGPSYYHRKGLKITLGDRDKNKNNWMYVIKYKDLLWADRNILVNISWDDLKEQGYAD